MDPELSSALRRLILGPAAEGSAQAADRLAFWLAATGGQTSGSKALDLALAGDVMALCGVQPAATVLARRGPMLDRAATTLRASTGKKAGEVEIAARRVAYAGFYALEAVDLRFRRFDGQMSPQIRREGFIGSDAVTVLPYDPVRDRVLVIEQLRIGPLLRGDPAPWQVEAVAGRIDAGETPEATARREALEEAALELHKLLPVSAYYPTPGAVSEFIYSFVGLCDLPDGAAGIHGLASEAEDIKGHILTFPEALARADRGEFANAPLVLTLNWLDRQRARLREEAGAGI